MIQTELMVDMKKRQKARIPGVIVPGSVMPLNLSDKDGNVVHRVVAYTAQLDEAVKAVRRAGFTCKEFEYNKE